MYDPSAVLRWLQSPMRQAYSSVFYVITALALSSCMPAQNPTASGIAANLGSARCAYNREEMLALDVIAFDQTAPAGGWRSVDSRGCHVEAADLIRDYRESHRSEYMPLYWHEGQMRAIGGQTDRALELFQQARGRVKPGYWQHYADATIAFMKRDKAALLESRDALAALPRPENFNPRDAHGNPVTMTWPPFLDVADRLVRCFDRSYAEAYRSCGRPDSDSR